MDGQTQLIEAIGKYLAKHSLSRASFAELIGVAPSTLDKVMSCNMAPSSKFVHKVTVKTGITLGVSGHVQFDFQFRRYARKEVAHLEGCYQTLRPSYRDSGQIHGYVTVIEWNEEYQCLSFHELDNDLSPQNAGYISIPLYNRMMYFVTCDRGNFRLAIVSDAYKDGEYYGGILTVGSQKMAEKVPTSAIFAIKKIASKNEAVFGAISKEHHRYEELHGILRFAQDEGFFRGVPLP